MKSSDDAVALDVDEPTLQPWREVLVQRILIASVVLGTLALVPSSYAAYQEELWLVLGGDIGAYLLLLIAAVAGGLPYKLRAWCLVVVPLLVGTMLLYILGLAGASLLWLVVPVQLAVLLLGRRSALITAGVIGVALALVTVQQLRGALSWTLPWEIWLTFLGNFVAITALLFWATTYLLRRLLLVVDRERHLSAERGILIGEIQHRVKNNLQLMVSLLHLQAGWAASEELRRAILSSEARLRSMGLAHEVLYRQEEKRFIELSRYLPTLVEELEDLHSAGGLTETHFLCDDCFLTMEQAVPMSVLIQELLVNALRHAFPGDTVGAITVTVRSVDGLLEVTVSDNGIGFDSESAAGGGLSIARALADQLDGELHLRSGAFGTEGRFLMKLPPRE